MSMEVFTTYEIELDSFCEEIFHYMESIQDGSSGHIITFNARNKDDCVDMISQRLKSFIDEKLEEVK